MANIYLRLPRIQACVMRNLDDDNPLACSQPFKVPDFDPMASIIRSGLVIQGSLPKKDPVCFSQQEWQNMMQGKHPQGGKAVIKRNADEWLTYKEVCDLFGSKMMNVSDDYDYLCIQMPREVLIGKKMYATNQQWKLEYHIAHEVVDMFAVKFKFALSEWQLGNYDYCTRDGRIIRRPLLATLERFCMRYDVPIDKEQRQILRRQFQRWMDEARMQYRAYRHIDIEFEDSKDKVVEL